MSRTGVILGLFLIAGVVESGPILTNVNAEETTPVASNANVTSSPSLARQGQPQFNPAQSQQGPMFTPFGVNPLAMNPQRNPQFQGLPTMPTMQGKPPQFSQQIPPNQFAMPPLQEFGFTQQTSSINKTKPSSSPTSPSANNASKPVTSTTTDPRRSVEEVTTTTTAKPFRETPLGNDQKSSSGPALLKEPTTNKFKTMPLSVPMPLPIPMPMPWLSLNNPFVGMTPMMPPSLGFSPNAMKQTNQMWPFMWDASPWMFPGGPLRFPSGFEQQALPESSAPMGNPTGNQRQQMMA